MSGAREQLDSEQLERLQNRIATLEQRIQTCPFFVGRRVDVDLTASPLQIAHGLGKAPAGILILSTRPAAVVGFSPSQPVDRKSFVNVQSSVASTCSLWFF